MHIGEWKTHLCSYVYFEHGVLMLWGGVVRGSNVNVNDPTLEMCPARDVLGQKRSSLLAHLKEKTRAPHSIVPVKRNTCMNFTFKMPVKILGHILKQYLYSAVVP
jgi:hypothetical protein